MISHQFIFVSLLFTFISLSSIITPIDPQSIKQTDKQTDIDLEVTQLEEIELTFDRSPYIWDETAQFYSEYEMLSSNDKEYKTVLLLSKTESDIATIVEVVKQIIKEDGWRHATLRHKIFSGKHSEQNLLRIQEKLNLLDESVEGKLSHGFSQDIIDRAREDGYSLTNIHESIFAQKNRERVYSNETQIEEVEVVFECVIGKNDKKYKTIIFLSEADSDIISMAEDIIDIIVKRGGWEFKSFSHKIFLGKYRNQNALQIQEKLNNIDRTKNSSVLVIVD